MRVPRHQKKSLAERFWPKVQKAGPDDCWIWQAATMPNGYGNIMGEDGKHMTAHRAAWIIHHGPVEKGLDVCHSCDVRNCVNVAHLFLGTRSDNMQDAAAKGRNIMQVDPSRSNLWGRKWKQRGEVNGKTKLTVEKVLEIKHRLGLGHPKTHIADDFGVSPVTIGDIAKGRTWSYLPTEVARDG